MLELKETVGDLYRYIDSLQNHLAPIHWLPPEILCSIFESAYDENMDYTADAFRFSHVCQQWRNTAIAFPRLWSDVIIDTRPAEAHAECLRRSLKAPLSVSIRIPVGGGEEEEPGDREPVDLSLLPPAVHDGVELLARKHNRTRIRDVHILIPEYLEYVVEALLDFDTPNLRYIKYESPGISECTHLVTLFKNNHPNVQSLSLCNIFMPRHYEGANNSYMCGFSNLTKLHIYSTTKVRFVDPLIMFEALRSSPRLESLHVQDCQFFEDLEEEFEVVPLHALTEIILIDTEFDFILTRVHIPNVVQFTVRSFHHVHLDQMLPASLGQLPIIQCLETLTIKQASRLLGGTGVVFNGASGKIMEPTQSMGVLKSFRGIVFPGVTFLTASVRLDSSQAKVLVESLPSLRRLAMPGVVTSRITNALCLFPVACPDLEEISLTISSSSYRFAFNQILPVIVSRLGTGQSIRVGHIVPVSMRGDPFIATWEKLWSDYNVVTFLDESDYTSHVGE